MSDHTEPTIAPKDFLPLKRQHFEAFARRLFFRIVEGKAKAELGSLHLVEQWGNHRSERVIGHGALSAELVIRDRGAYAAFVFGGSRGMGRSYVNGLWDTSDMTALVRYLFRVTQPSRRRLDRWARRGGVLWALSSIRRPSKAKDRENIHAHYDLSNEFFTIMLDETMAYSCAIFHDETTSLHDAQVEKFDRLCRKLQLKPGEHVLEIGTGWGGFAIHAATRYGVHVTTTTISENQRHAAIARINDAGLSQLITVLGDHYEELTGEYDALVSVEMIEAVSWKKYDEFFVKCSSLLKSDGRMAIQAITISDQSFDRAKIQEDFIRDLIFPGGCLPSVTAMLDSVTKVTDLTPIDLDDFGLHYAMTLTRWRANFMSRYNEITELGFDDRFKRLWDMYLCYCEAAFLERHISDVQLVLHKPGRRPVLGFRPT